MLDVETAPRSRMNKDLRREAILTEAIRALSEKGYHGFSINELARRCGLTTAGILHHFGSKQGLLIALLDMRDRLDQQAILPLLAPEDRRVPSTRDSCLTTLRAIMARNAEQPEIIRLYAILRTEAVVPDHPAFTFFRTREMAVLNVFRDMVSDLVPDPLSTARQILALIGGLEMQWLRESRIFDLVAEWDSAISKILPPPS
ncbi:TetR/AcrR family transcriptional regulator [Sphingobium sufflavum]|uniref:TetR/AcrR family transcriptional regulator n=1 Tax=Sphingobium sufflavum TaxID=1129547 RepID=UPI001F174B7A|nr:TetR/AcrR family transcriptional regulator [Sphingobium sufflavum]MCE7796001.1 TetR/AcrR family transcriptional regulator [Sphingobium sufflavum]